MMYGETHHYVSGPHTAQAQLTTRASTPTWVVGPNKSGLATLGMILFACLVGGLID